MSALYELRGVRQAYGARVVLDIDALDVQAGEILAVVGPSGAGKSTLLRLLNFLEPPAAGSLAYDGQPANGGAAPLDVMRRVTTVFQRPVLLNQSVRDNVAYGLKLRGVRDPEGMLRDGAAVEAALERVGLASLAGQAAQKLSGGEAQRVAVARALVLSPQALLLDEPTANLDPYHVGLIEDIVRAENQARGVTVVMVTHNVFQAKRLAHRVAFLLAGRLVEAAPVDDFFNTPSDPRTAAFVRGDMVY